MEKFIIMTCQENKKILTALLHTNEDKNDSDNAPMVMNSEPLENRPMVKHLLILIFLKFLRILTP